MILDKRRKAMPIDELRLRRFARLAAPMLRGSSAQGIGPHASRNRAGAGLEFLDLRDYTMGEDARHIDWRQTARRQRIVVRQYRDETASDWLLCVDGSASMRDDAKWRLVTELTTALAYLFIYASHSVALAVFAERVHARCPAGRGQRQFAAIVRELSAYNPPSQGGASLPGLCAPLIGKTGNVVVLSDFLREDAMNDDLRRLRAQVSTASAIQVLANDETNLHASGPAVIFDSELGNEQRLDLGAAATSAAAGALDAHNRRLRARITSLGIRFSACKAGDTWERVLLAHLGA